MSVIAGVLIAAAASCVAQDVGDLLGRWESRGTSRGGIGEVLDLRSDGSFVQASLVLVNLRYEVRADELLIEEPKPGGKTEGRGVAFRVEDGVFIRGAGVAQEVRAERVGAAERDPASVVGTWKYRHYTGVIAYERYTPDGELLLRLPMKAVKGCFAVDGAKGEIAFSLPVGTRPPVQFALEGESLRVQLPGGSSMEYRRTPGGAWYDIDAIDYVPPKRR